MKDRIKALRDHFDLNQEDFGARIGVKRSTITNYETGARVPIDAVITSICKEYGCCREWLEDGIEPMFPPSSDNDMELVMRSMRDSSESKKKLIRILSDMPDELLDKFMEYLESKN